ncbi:uncharacterized protein LOC144148535 [Haemaphysalis longicornis]
MTGSCLSLASLLSLLAIVARAGQFSQRLDAPFSAFGWAPLVPVAANPQNLQQPVDNGRSYNARNQDNTPPANGAVDNPRLLSASPPHSRTVTASITWPPDHAPDPGPLPDDDIDGSGQQDDDPIAAPQTDPPVLETPNGRHHEDDRVVKTTLRTPLSHGYVVALVKKPRRLKSYFKSKVQDAVPDDQPAFFVYMPPNRQNGIRRNQLALRARGAPQLRANGGPPPVQYQRAGPTRSNGAMRYAVLPIVGPPEAVNELSQHLQGLRRQAPPAVLVYLPPERQLQLNAPVIIPINPPVPLNSVLHHNKPDVGAPVLSGGFLNGASPGAPWLPPSLESTPEEVLKYAWSQMGKYRA